MKRVSLWTGFLVAVALTVPFVALLYLASVLLMVPFPAFDLFDFMARSLPGDILTFGIDTMVDTIRALNLGSTDETAKLAEQLMAVLTFTIIGIISGTIYFAVVDRVLKNRATLQRDNLLSGAILGLAFGLPLMAITAEMNVSATAPGFVSMLWLLIAYAGWGVAHGYLYGTLAEAEAPADASVRTLDRRRFLIQLGASSATITVVGAGLSALINTRVTEGGPTTAAVPVASSAEDLLTSLPNADATVQSAPGTRPEYTPLDNHYRIDINSGRPPALEQAEYRLNINGLVDNPTELTLDQIQNDFPVMNQFITMSCISNRLGGDLISTILWTGTSMQNLLDLVQPMPEATHIKITAADGFDEYVALDLIREDERIMLTYAWDNQPLPGRHGFPLRIHIPNRFGMKQPKWITNMEFVAEWGEGYWVRRGWSEEAIAVTTSVIDTVAADMMIIDAETEEMRVPVGGIAWAGARGISRVEVRVDDGEWQETQLRAPLSDKTWVIWRYDWLFEAGDHKFEVRCFETDGTPQLEERRGVRPDGATGIHSDTVRL